MSLFSSKFTVISCFILATMILNSTLSKTVVNTDLCTPGKCVLCNISGEKAYCKACLNSVLGGTAADFKDGFCEGESTNIPNCLVSTREGATAKCKRCSIGYQPTPQGGCTASTIADCLIFNGDGSSPKCLACGNNKYPNYSGTSCGSATSTIANCRARRDSSKCFLCDDNFLTNKRGDACEANPAEPTLCERTTTGYFFLTSSGEKRSICSECNFWKDYVTLKVYNDEPSAGKDFSQICIHKSQASKIGVFPDWGPYEVNLSSNKVVAFFINLLALAFAISLNSD